MVTSAVSEILQKINMRERESEISITLCEGMGSLPPNRRRWKILPFKTRVEPDKSQSIRTARINELTLQIGCIIFERFRLAQLTGVVLRSYI